MNRVIRIASFDIGKKNFAQYIEECDIDVLYKLRDKYRTLPKLQQRRVKGKMNEEIDSLLKDMYIGGRRLHTGVYDFRSNKESNELDMSVRKNLIKHLKSHRDLWKECKIFIIEQQYFATFNQYGNRGGKSEANIDAIKLAEATLTWFLSEYEEAEVLYFSSVYKTQMLGAEPMKEIERKRWAIGKAKEIYTLREDEEVIKLYNLSDKVKRIRMNNEDKVQKFIEDFDAKEEDMKELGEKVIRYKQKLCDISDAMLQLQAFKYRTFIGEF